MVKDEFVDLLNIGREKEPSEGEGTVATIIKDNDLTVSGTTAVTGESEIIENESFVLKLHKKGDVLDAIEIECRCGRTATIQLQYESSEAREEADSELLHNVHQYTSPRLPEDMLQKSADSPETKTSRKSEKDDEFQEGLPARTIAV